MMGGDSETPVTVEPQRLTEDSVTAVPSHALRHGDVRIGAPREPTLLLQPRLLLVHNVVHLAICTIRVGTDRVLFSLLCAYLVELELEIQFHVHSEDLDGSGTRPILSLWSNASCSRPWDIDGRNKEVEIRPLSAALKRLSFNFNGHQPQNWKRSPGRPLPLAVSCRLTWLTSRREFAGLSVWQPHEKVNTQKGETGFEWGAPGARPPSLSGNFWGFPLFSALQVPRDDHTLKV